MSNEQEHTKEEAPASPLNSGSTTTKVLPLDAVSDDTLLSHGSAASHPVGTLAGQFGRYSILRLLGRGGMGEVYLAEDTVLGRRLAIKVPLTGRLDEETKERFYREARAAAKLLDPHLCPVFDVGEIEGRLYITMPFIEGQSLSEVVRRGPLPPRQAAELIETLAVALQKAHEQGILHRDLKSSNVMLSKGGEPIVMDFGLARLHEQQHDARMTATGIFLGTPAYAPPEQLQGEMSSLTPASDVYSLGVVLFEMLTGRLPFTGSVASVMKQVLTDPPPRPSSFIPGIGPSLEAVCLRALAKLPGERYSSMTEMAEAIRRALQDDPVEARRAPSPDNLATTVVLPPKVPVPAKPRRKWVPWLMGSMLVGVTVLAPVLICAGCVSLMAYLPEMVARSAADLQPGPDLRAVAEFWRPPSEMPPDLAKLTLPGHTLLEQEDIAELPDFQIKVNARHARFRQAGGTIELFIAKASELEKELVYHKVLAIVNQHQDRPLNEVEFADSSESSLPPYPHYPDRIANGSAADRYLYYRFRQDFKKPGDAATFWWDEDWLFIARTDSNIDPRFFLRDVLVQLNDAKPGRD